MFDWWNQLFASANSSSKSTISLISTRNQRFNFCQAEDFLNRESSSQRVTDEVDAFSMGRAQFAADGHHFTGFQTATATNESAQP